MTSNPLCGISIWMIFALTLSYTAQTCSALPYQQVLDHITERKGELFKHPLFAFLRDRSIAPERRMQFAPYWAYFALQAADILNYWIRYENPKNALEELVNEFTQEDDFHYNLFLHDVKALGYTIDRYGSFEAVLRHLWSDETHSIRQFFYHWAAVTVMYRDDPMVAMTTFETAEAGLSVLLGICYKSVYGEGGLTKLKYFGKEHVELEMTHNVTAWFISEENLKEEKKEKDEDLAAMEITELQRKLYIEVADDLFDRYVAIYNELHDLEVAEDSIHPGKFIVEGYPTLDQFPSRSNAAMMSSSKEEL